MGSGLLQVVSGGYIGNNGIGSFTNPAAPIP